MDAWRQQCIILALEKEAELLWHHSSVDYCVGGKDCIGVQATAFGRRKYGTKGKALAQQGRPFKQALAIR